MESEHLNCVTFQNNLSKQENKNFVLINNLSTDNMYPVLVNIFENKNV